VATVRVTGLRELQAAFRKIDKQLSKELRVELREAGKIVQQEATSLFSRVDARSAAGYKVRVRGKGVAVEQSLGRTTGQHAQYGTLQMRRALQPALESKESAVVDRLEQMLDKLGSNAGF
jgi:hypothetical protein